MVCSGLAGVFCCYYPWWWSSKGNDKAMLMGSHNMPIYPRDEFFIVARNVWPAKSKIQEGPVLLIGRTYARQCKSGKRQKRMVG